MVGSDPVVSVVVPAHNAADHIRPTLESLASQTSSRFEVVIVDDGSEDDLGAVLERFPVEWRLLRQENRGAAAARNAGADMAEANYLAFLDSDDVLSPDWVEWFTYAARSAPATIYCSMRVVESGTGKESIVSPGPQGAAFHYLEGLMLPGAYAVRRDTFRAAGGFHEGLTYGEHTELGLRLAPLVSDQQVPSVIVDRVLVTKYHDRTPAKLASYDRSRRLGAEYVLDTHGEQMARDPKLLGDYHAVAGVASFRLGAYREGREHFWAAVGAGGDRSMRQLLRFLISVIPYLGRWYWRRNDVDPQ
jgi:glycosyltransferase involved in cell wall biosynthesis